MYICTACNYLYNISVGAAEIIFSVSCANKVFCNEADWCNNETIWNVIFFGISVPLCFVENMKPFTYLSIFSMSAIVMGWIGVLSYCFSWLFFDSKGGITNNNIYLPDDINGIHYDFFNEWSHNESNKIVYAGSISNIPAFIGFAIFSVESLGCMLPIRNGMKQPKHFRVLFISTLIGVGSFIMLFGTLGYLVFGDVTQTVIFDNFPKDKLFVYICEMGYALGCIVTFPLYVTVACMAIFRLPKLDKIFDGKRGYWWGSLVRFISIVVLYAISISKIKIDAVMSISGAFCNSYLAIIMPN